MAALTSTTAFARKRRNGQAAQRGNYQVGTSAVIYQGGLVAMNLSTGRAVAATAATSRKILGVALESASSGAYVEVEWGAEYAFDPATALTKAYTGSNVAVSTDNDVTTMSGAGTTAVRVRVGELIDYDSTSVAWVAVRNFSEADV